MLDDVKKLSDAHIGTRANFLFVFIIRFVVSKFLNWLKNYFVNLLSLQLRNRLYN